jgi:hypothetical protein
MRKSILLALWFLICAAAGSAQPQLQPQQQPQTQSQQTTASPPVSTSWKFRSENYLGLAAGQWGNYGLLQTVNGVYKGPWFVGLGVGMDNYRFRSVPLFVSVTRDLPVFSKKSGLFLNLDGGTNLPWYKRGFPYYGEGLTSQFHAGSWWSAGLGYKWPLGPRTGKAVLLSVNYSEKRLKEVQQFATPCAPSVCGISNQTYMYEYLNRVFLFKIGFMF